jgi:hypothetical protein
MGASSRIASAGASGRPLHKVGGDHVGAEPGPGEILAQSVEPVLRRIHRRHLETRRRELHGLAAGGRAQVKDAAPIGRAEQPRRHGSGDVLHPPAAFAETGDPRHGLAARQAQMAGKEALALQLRRAVGREAEVERRRIGDRSAGGGDRLRPPRRFPAARHGGRQRRRFGQGRPASHQGAEHAVHQPARAARDQRQRRRDRRMRRRSQPQRLRQRDPQHAPRLGIVGQRPIGRGVDQRIQIGQPPQHFGGDGERQRAIRRERQRPHGIALHRLQRQSLAQHRVHQRQRGPPHRHAGSFNGICVAGAGAAISCL